MAEQDPAFLFAPKVRREQPIAHPEASPHRFESA